MVELLCGLGMIGFLYWLGGVWLPDHKPIEQELMGVSKDEPNN